MHNGLGHFVPVATFLDNPFDRAVDTEEVLHLPDVLGLLGHQVVFGRKLQCLLKTVVLRSRHQETQTQIGQPNGDAFHLTLPASSAAPISE